jgi:hypothetical protein
MLIRAMRNTVTDPECYAVIAERTQALLKRSHSPRLASFPPSKIRTTAPSLSPPIWTSLG